MHIELTRKFLAAVKKLPESDAAAIDSALSELLHTFGRPHVHTGASVRPLVPPLYELRAGLHLRIVFVRDGDVLKVDFVGNHNDVKSYLRG